MNQERPILIVDDSEDDAFLVTRTLTAAGVVNPLVVLRDGEAAISYLDGTAKYSDRLVHPLPCLVLLDLKMPGKNGLEVLKWIRAHPALKKLRVIVITSSTELRNVNLAYQFGADSFLVKPLELEDHKALLSTIQAQQVVQLRAG